jgi:hypothetical protein
VETKAEVKTIVARLDRVNGSVARHKKESREHDQHIAARSGNCPLVDQVEHRLRPVEDFITAEKAAAGINKTWMDRLWPFIWAACGILGLVVLQNAAALLKHVGY